MGGSRERSSLSFALHGDCKLPLRAQYHIWCQEKPRTAERVSSPGAGDQRERLPGGELDQKEVEPTLKQASLWLLVSGVHLSGDRRAKEWGGHTDTQRFCPWSPLGAASKLGKRTSPPFPLPSPPRHTPFVPLRWQCPHCAEGQMKVSLPSVSCSSRPWWELLVEQTVVLRKLPPLPRHPSLRSGLGDGRKE